MKSLARAVFILTILSTIIILIGWVIPCWFGRTYKSVSSKLYWGLFYVVECKSSGCVSITRSLKNEHLDYRGAIPPLQVEAIAALATISVAICLFALILIVILQCRACSRRQEYKRFVISAFVAQVTTATFVFLTIILSAVANGAFFSKVSMRNADEFPWSLFLFCLAEALLVASAVILLLIMRGWKKHRHLYTKHEQPTSTEIVPYKVHEKRVTDVIRVEPYDSRPFYDYPHTWYRDQPISVNSGYYDKIGVPYYSMYGRTRYYLAHPPTSSYLDYPYIADRQVVPYYSPHAYTTGFYNRGLYDYSPISNYWNRGYYDYAPTSSVLWNYPGTYDNTIRRVPMLYNDPTNYTNDYYNNYIY